MAGGSNPPGRATDFRHLPATGKCLFAIFPIPFTAICQELEHLNEVLKVLTYPTDFLQLMGIKGIVAASMATKTVFVGNNVSLLIEGAGLVTSLLNEAPPQKSYHFDVA